MSIQKRFWLSMIFVLILICKDVNKTSIEFTLEQENTPIVLIKYRLKEYLGK